MQITNRYSTRDRCLASGDAHGEILSNKFDANSTAVGYLVAMPKTTTQFTAVISCPSDMQADRDAVEEALEELNADESLKVSISVRHWKRDASPDIGADPQQVINEQIFKDYDILIA